jgi:integrase
VRLTAKTVATLKMAGSYADDDCPGLYLRIERAGSRSWVLRTIVHGRRRKMGLGSTALVGLAEAREKARVLRKVARDGGDPLAERRRQRLTLRQVAEKVHAGLLPTWKNAKHAESWLASLKSYAFPTLGDRPIDTLTSADILAVLSPVWTARPETAKRVRQRLSTIFDWAIAGGHFTGQHPVAGVTRALPAVKRSSEHYEALPWQDVPAFALDLRQREGTSARLLEFAILTAARSGEARGARWDEIAGGVWTVPASRMKRGVPHRVPLSAEALGVLDQVRGLDPVLVFPSPQRAADGSSRPASDMVFKALFTRMGRATLTAHGFRSSFRDWASESAHAPREVAEAALSHATGDATERAYARSDLLDRRRALMDRWGAFVAGRAAGVVLDLPKRA